MKNNTLCLSRVRLAALILCAAFSLHFQRANAANISNLPAATAADLKGKTFDLSKMKLTMAQIQKLPDDAQITVPGGNVVSAKRYRKIAMAIQKIQQRKLTLNSPMAFSRTQGVPSAQISKGVDLKKLMARPDSDVLQLPDGRKITVKDLKGLSELYQQLHGQSLESVQGANVPKRPNLAGKAIMVSSVEEIQKMSDLPDDTIVENPKGKRATLGEIRKYAQVTGKPVGVGR